MLETRERKSVPAEENKSTLRATHAQQTKQPCFPITCTTKRTQVGGFRNSPGCSMPKITKQSRKKKVIASQFPGDPNLLKTLKPIPRHHCSNKLSSVPITVVL